jgi:hypothetical protein
VSVTNKSILDGTLDPADLHAVIQSGQTVLMVGTVAVAAYETGDVGLRNIAVVTLTEMGFPGRRVGEVVGLTREYVSELRGQVRREGSTRLVRGRGRPPKLSEAQVRQARAWKAAGMRDAEIARRLKVDHKTAARVVADVRVVVQGELDLPAAAQPGSAVEDAPDAVEGELPHVPADAPASPIESTVDIAGWSGPDGPAAPVEPVAGAARIGTGSFGTRYAGAALLHAFTDRVDIAGIFAAAAAAGVNQAGLRLDYLAVLAATSMVFGLGFASLEQAKHPDRAQVGPVVGIDVLPDLRTLRPRLSAIADRCDPLSLQKAIATAMLQVEPNLSGVYFVDEHFIPYTGALPVAAGWNTKRRHAEPGWVDTVIADPKGRAICFTNGEPSGLSTSLPATVDQLREIVGPDTPIMLGFDRGGAYPAVFRACRKRDAHWVTYRRAPLATPTGLPIHVTIHHSRKPVTIAYAEQTVDINDYGPARQITLFEHGRAVLQILTSDTTACPAALILYMRARWRIGNFFKHLDFYGIDHLTDYHATITPDTHKIDNPERKKLKNELKALTTANVADPDPDATRAVHRTHRRALQMTLRMLAANAENWLAHHLNAYLQDNDEYRAATRSLLHLAGIITYTDTTITVELDQPNIPRLTRALTLLLDEINQTPPRIPGDARPLTYRLKRDQLKQKARPASYEV